MGQDLAIDVDSMQLAAPGPAGAGPLVALRRPAPLPEPRQLLLRVAACAVCRTDLQLAEGQVAAKRLPIVLGHQVVGRVEAVGDAVRGWSVDANAALADLAGGRLGAPAGVLTMEETRR